MLNQQSNPFTNNSSNPVPEQVTPEPVMTNPVNPIQKQVTPEPVMTNPVNPIQEQVTLEPVITNPEQVTLEPVITNPEQVTPEPVMTNPEQVISEPVMTNPVNPIQEQVISDPVMTNPEQVTPEPVMTEPVMTNPVQVEPIEVNPISTSTSKTNVVGFAPEKINRFVEDPEEIEKPLASINQDYQPNVNSTKIIAELTSGNYDNLIKILQLLIKEDNDTISIRKSTVIKSNSDSIIQANMVSIWKDKNGNYVDLDIINPKKYIKLFEQFKSQNNIFIINDDENSRYVLTNGEVKLFLPKQDTIVDKNIETFDVSNGETICQTSVDKDIRRIIKNLSKGQEHIDFLIQDNKLKGIYIPDTAIYTFAEYKSDPKSQNVHETNADLSLKSTNFLPIEAENYNVYIIKNNDVHVMLTDCKIGGKIDVRIHEALEISTGGNLIF